MVVLYFFLFFFFFLYFFNQCRLMNFMVVLYISTLVSVVIFWKKKIPRPKKHSLFSCRANCDAGACDHYDLTTDAAQSPLNH